MVSLRGGALWLLSLRGRFRVDGTLLGEVELVPGLVVDLSPGTRLTCVGVELPEAIVGIDVAGLGVSVLAGTTSLLKDPVRLEPGLVEGAQAVFWPLEERWMIRRGSMGDEELRIGVIEGLEGVDACALLIPLDKTARTRTVPVSGNALSLEWCRTDLVLHVGEEQSLRLTGLSARLLGVLMEEESPLHWVEVCARVWPEDKSDPLSLRNRLDVGVSRLRLRLRELALPALAVSFDGSGYLRLLVPSGVLIRRQVGNG